MRSPAAVVLSACLVLVGWARGAVAQEAVNYGSVSGTIVDATGAPVLDAQVTARETTTGVRHATAVDRAGRFRFAYLRPGRYDIGITAPGFASVARGLTVAAGSAFDLPIELTAGAAESVTVLADATIIEAARSQIAATLRQAEVQAVPLNGRNFLDLALLAPGVSPTNVGAGTQLFPETSAVPGVGLSVSSQRNLSNNFMVDGLSANDDAAALSGISFSVDAIGQMQIVTSGGQAELGRALGGHVNVTTRSGTDIWRGEGYGFFRDESLNGRNALSGSRLPMHQNQFGGSLGGPITHQRTFVFGNIEWRDLTQSGLTTIRPEDASAINARLVATGYRGLPVATGLYSNPVETLHALTRFDHHFGSGAHLSARYSSYAVSSQNARGAGGLSAPSASAGLDNLDQTLAGAVVLGLRARTLLEARGQIARGDLEALPTDPAGPAVTLSGVASFGRLATSPTGRLGTLRQGIVNVLHQRGAHAFRAGIDVLHNDVTITFPRAQQGTYAFSSLASFLAGVYNNSGFMQTFGDTAVSLTNPNVGLYLQDEWRAGGHVTINAGLRYDLQRLETIRTDRGNLSPRVGVAWSPTDARRFVVRASAGRFYDRVPLRALANALLSAGNTTDPSRLRQTSVSLSPAQAGAPVFPDGLTSVVPTTTLVNFTTMDRGLENAYSNQMSVELERQLGKEASVAVSYQHLRGNGLLMQINQNVPTCAAVAGNNGCRPNPAFANNNQYRAAGRSEYDGLHVSLVQRAGRWGSYRLSYTLSKSMNNLGETFFAAPLDPLDLSKDWGPSDDDQRHRLMVSASLTSPVHEVSRWWHHMVRGTQFSGTVQYYSALPFNILTGATTIQGTAARPVVDDAPIERNLGRGSPFSMVNVRVARQWRVGKHVTGELLIEAFNFLNRRNDLARVAVFGTGSYPEAPAPTFGQVTVVGDPRLVQLGFRVRF